MTHITLMDAVREEYGEEPEEMDIEAAIYYFASHYHDGQGSDLYAILSASDYIPGAMETYDGWADECYEGSCIYDFLVDRHEEGGI